MNDIRKQAIALDLLCRTITSDLGIRGPSCIRDLLISANKSLEPYGIRVAPGIEQLGSLCDGVVYFTLFLDPLIIRVKDFMGVVIPHSLAEREDRCPILYPVIEDESKLSAWLLKWSGGFEFPDFKTMLTDIGECVWCGRLSERFLSNLSFSCCNITYHIFSLHLYKRLRRIDGILFWS